MLFTEISQLSYGEVPRGAIAITSSGSPPNTFWREVARYVLYEEVFDDDLKQFNTPQYPSISYQYFDRLCNIFNKDSGDSLQSPNLFFFLLDMKLLNSAAKTSESLMAEIANFAADDACLARANDAEALLTTLLAYRWHPQVNPRQGIYRLPRFSVTGPGRRISLVSRAEAVSDLTNKYLSVCLPRHSESCNIMIGRLKCLTKPLFLLVRILNEQTTNITGLVEVDVPLRFVLLLITPSSSEEKDLHQIGRCFASMLNDQKFLADLYRVQKPADLYQSAISFRKNMIVLSSGLPEVLNHSGGIDVPIAYYNEVYFERSDLVFEDYAADMSNRQFLDSDVGHKSGKMHFCSKHSFQRLWPPFNELVKGVKVFASRLPSDYTDAFTKDNVGTMLSSILFIYFVVFGPAITFGTLMINEVHPNYAISLNIFATGIFTVLYSLLAGQPLGSIGPSGPGFILETVIALVSSEALITFAVPQDVSIPVNVNDTEELQSALQSNQTASKAAANLFLATCMLIFSILINKLKRSHFFRRKFRYWIGAFNVPLGIVFVTLVEYTFFSSYNVQKLDIPAASENDPNEWVNVIDISKVINFTQPSPAVLHGLALLLGFFFALLVFTETALNSVTALKPKAKKPSPFVMDHVLTVVLFPLISCTLGWPFMSGVPVRTIANTMALVKVDPHPPPGKPAEIISLVEQRVSVLIVGVLVTFSVYLGDILRLIPVAALYGMFIYLGLCGLRGLDSVNALLALLTRRKYWGRWEFLTNLPKAQLAVITAINFTELAILIIFIVTAEFATAGYTALATPLVLIGSGLIREFCLPRWQWLAPTLEKVNLARSKWGLASEPEQKKQLRPDLVKLPGNITLSIHFNELSDRQIIITFIWNVNLQWMPSRHVMGREY
ncbi:unnamed protein product [Mesocestoides corti]|uniref:Uncharacterized protein n=1 Tax=Mesocestoides corti TaxID=53468 RepID=A0A3P6HTN8_MESCO|nr:unnamed protein product [Mesocestoides corti]